MNAKQQLFVQEYLVDLNATQAAMRAGYSKKSAHVHGSRLLENAEIRAAVDAAVKARSADVGMTAREVLLELKRLAGVDVGEAFDAKGRLKPLAEMHEDVRRSISSLEIEELFDGHGENRVRVGNLVKLKFWDKVRGLELAGKHLKLFTEKVESTSVGLVVHIHTEGGKSE